MPSWSSESQPKDWQKIRISRGLSQIKERLTKAPVIRAAKVIWSNTDHPGGVTAYWLAGGKEKTDKRR